MSRALATAAASAALLAATLAFGGGLPLAEAGSSSPEVSVTVSQRVLHSRGNRSFSVFLHVRNEGEARTVGIEVGGMEWPYPTLGGPLAFGAPSMQGPGAVRVGSAPVPPLPAGACVRGVPLDFTLLLVNVPAQTSTTVELPVTAIVPAWPGTQYTPRVTLNYDNAPAAREISVPHVRMAGPTGFLIRLKTRPADAIRAGRPVTIVGSTSPAVRRASVRVFVRSAPLRRDESPARARLIGVVRTDGEGRFRVAKWMPARAGEYQVLAKIAHPGGGLLHDSTCPITVSIAPRRRK